MPFMISPVIIAALVAAVLQVATLGWGVYQSNRADRAEVAVQKCRTDHEFFVKMTVAQAEEAKAKAKATEDANKRNADEIAKGWAAALDVVRTDASRRVRIAARSSAGGSGLSAPTKVGPQIAGADEDTIPSPERVAADCAETTLTANFLQRYIEDLR